MNRRSFLQSVPIGAAALQALGQQAMAQQYAGHHIAEPTPNPRPNIIWILGDQFRAQALASNGDPNARTPNLDRAAVNGVTFTSHVSGYPLCCPFRGSMLTSRYPNQCVPGHEYPLPEGQKTIADVFNANNYHTAYFGKWHLGGFHERDGRAAFFITELPTPRAVAASKAGPVTKITTASGIAGCTVAAGLPPSITGFPATKPMNSRTC